MKFGREMLSFLETRMTKRSPLIKEGEERHEINEVLVFL